ncbi:Protein Soga1 [Manis pentadactyla]|nr:Protein Soga1 [Manis pentadactyla]
MSSRWQKAHFSEDSAQSPEGPGSNTAFSTKGELFQLYLKENQEEFYIMRLNLKSKLTQDVLGTAILYIKDINTPKKRIWQINFRMTSTAAINILKTIPLLRGVSGSHWSFTWSRAQLGKMKEHGGSVKSPRGRFAICVYSTLTTWQLGDRTWELLHGYG